MFQWSGAVYSTFAGYFLFFFVSVLYMLICEANGWTGFGVMGFLPKGRSEQKVILHLHGTGKDTTVLWSCALP